MSSKLRFARGGAVSPGQVYVLRTQDAEFLSLARSQCWFTVSGCRTMGKTSLALHWRDTLRDEGINSVRVDVAGIGKPRSVGAWFKAVERTLLDEIEVNPANASSRPNEVSPGRRLREILSSVELASIANKSCLLVIFDEVDWIETLDYGDELLAAFRECQVSQSARSERGGLSVCLMGLRPVHKIGQRSQFSALGPDIEMTDFAAEGKAIQAMVPGFQLTKADPNEVAARILTQTGGHPLLSNILAYELNALDIASLDEVDRFIDSYLSAQRSNPKDPFAQITEFFVQPQLTLKRFGGPGQALTTYVKLLSRKGRMLARREDDASELLLLSGLVRTRGDKLEIKSPMFRRYFGKKWIREMDDSAGSGRPVAIGARRIEKHRIFVLNTGGTIGMVRRGGSVVAPKDKKEFLENYEALQDVAEIEFEQPFKPLDSINVTPARWKRIAREIFKRRNDGFKGFVIAHGTDTMAFTASAVAFALGENLSFPVVFTGAQATPDVVHGDAHLNILRACLVASTNIHEVVISFGNHVFRAVRAQKKDERRFEGFESPVYPPLAEITEVIEIDSDRVGDFRKIRGSNAQGSNERVNVYAERLRPVPLADKIDLKDEFESGILMIQLTPGLEPDFYLPALDQVDVHTKKPKCQGVILQTLGAGNVTNIRPFGFVSFISKAIRKSVPVLITSPFPWRPAAASEFAPAAAAIDRGAIPSGDMTTAAAATKFRWVLAQVNSQIGAGKLCEEQRVSEVAKIMKQDLIGEVTARLLETASSPNAIELMAPVSTETRVLAPTAQID